MAEIFDSDVITYACACGHLNPIAKLFFCRHCLKLRCGFCVSHEVRPFDFVFTITFAQCDLPFL